MTKMFVSVDGSGHSQIVIQRAGTQGVKGDAGGQGIQGPQGMPGEQGLPGGPGPKGDDGREVELQKSATHVQWRYAGDSAWNNLVTLAEITGPQGERGLKGDKGDQGAKGDTGEQIELRATATHIQWRYLGLTTWTTLVALADLKGPQGDKGDRGETGLPGSAATVGVGSTSTGDPGTNATVTNAGTANAAVLHFVIPRGDKGETGDVNPGTIQARDDAEGFAELAQAWAEGTEPGGPGTKSSREYASDAAGSAATAAAATLVEYGVNLYDPDGLPSGGWNSKRYTPHANRQEIIFAEMEGEPGSSISFTMLAGGVPVYGPVVVTDEVLLTGLDIPVGTGEGVSYMVTTSAGVYRVNIESNGKLL